MTEGLNIELEKAKVRASYWNGIALATFAVGALPLLISAEPLTEEAVHAAVAPENLVQLLFLFPAWMLSLLFHQIAKRSFDKL